jgi:glutamine---fructose-6-phosphate transaminase (isomerizing)
VMKEAAKFQAECISAGQFRHGPIEMTDPRLTVFVVEGDAQNRDLNLRLAQDILRFGGQVFWVSPEPQEGLPGVLQPQATGMGRVAAEIAPFQMLSIALSLQTGVAPGIFRNMGKVVVAE